MKSRKIAVCIFSIILGITSCKKDDAEDFPEPILRDRTEQQVIDRDSLIGYLETHYYNSGTFVGNFNPSIDQIIISKLPEDGILPDPANNTILMDAVEVKNTVYIGEDEEVDYEYYVLRLNQGGGISSPNYFDNVRVNFSGYLLDETLFDSTATPTSLDLLSLVTGWNRVLTEFNTAESFIEVGDGTIGYTNYGLGVMFLPSGLAFYSTPRGAVQAYSPVIFRFELLETEVNDHDDDGVPTYLEDLEGDLSLANDDTDNDQLVNFLDANDDNDEAITRDEVDFKQYTVDTNQGEEEPVLASNEYEIGRVLENGVYRIDTVIIPSTNGIPDYLDETVN
jgi:hypothetical protein